jgi:hypothetical protein
VRDDLYDIHSGTIYNGIGKVIAMPRTNVTFDPQAACSAGLHVGTHCYANGWRGTDGVLLIVKVNPAHVVSVPYDCDSEKLRTSQYTVLAKGDEALDTTTIYTVDGKELDAVNYLADLREADYRRRRPSYQAPTCDDDDCDDDYDDDCTEYYRCDCCGWEAEKDEADDTFGKLVYCCRCGNELEVV